MWTGSGQLAATANQRMDTANSRRTRTRIEVWSAGTPVSLDAPFEDGSVTDDLAIGRRRTLDLTVPTSWEPWFNKPRLEVRPFRGVVWTNSEYLCPLGRFPVDLKEVSSPSSGVLGIQAPDYWSWVERADFYGPTPSYRGTSRDVLFRLIKETGLGSPDMSLYTSRTEVPREVWENSRAETFIKLCDAASSTAYFDRLGRFRVEAVQPGPLRTPLREGPTGSLVSVVRKFDDTNVYNTVVAYSSNDKVVFAPAVVELTDKNHPAHKTRIGTRVKTFASPIFLNRDQALQAARTLLLKSVERLETYEVQCYADWRRDSGDSFQLESELVTRNVTARRVFTPLRVEQNRHQTMTLTPVAA